MKTLITIVAIYTAMFTVANIMFGEAGVALVGLVALYDLFTMTEREICLHYYQ